MLRTSFKQLAVWRPVVIAALLWVTGSTSAMAVLPVAVPLAPIEAPVTQPDELVRLFKDDADRMTVPVTIGTGPPLSFLIDTGAERSGVANEVASQFGLDRIGSRVIVGFAGRHLVPTVRVPSLRYARSDRTDVEALLFSRSVIGADGFLGIDSLDGQRIDFDFVKHKMVLRRAPKSGLQASNDSVVVKAARRHGRLIFANAEIGRIKANVVLDTGSNVTIGNAALRAQLRARRKLGKTIPVYMLAITGEVVAADYGVLREVTVGGVLIRQLPIAFATVEPFELLGLTDRPALLLGMDALRVFARVSVDFRDRSVRFVVRDFYRADTVMRLGS